MDRAKETQQRSPKLAGIKSIPEKERLKMDKEIMGLIIKGWFKSDIIDHIMSKYGIESYDAAKREVTNVTTMFIEDNRVKLEEKKDLYLNHYYGLYKIAQEEAAINKRTKDAKDILDSICKLEGMYIDRKEIKIEDGFKVEF